MGFFDRNRKEVEEKGCDPNRLPPCQYLTDRFPVLHDLLTMAGIKPGATHIMGHAEFGYTANLPLEDALHDDSLVTWEFDGEPLEPIHGGPVRLMISNLYFWKSPKWLRGIEVMEGDKPGFWERNGYHMYGDPFREQRHWGD